MDEIRRALLGDKEAARRLTDAGVLLEVFGRKHNQQKKNFCDRCGQMIDWEGVEKEAQP